MQGRIITISRQCGSGGHSIGNELAKRLNVPFYDKEISIKKRYTGQDREHDELPGQSDLRGHGIFGDAYEEAN